MNGNTHASESLLGPADPPPFRLVDRRAASRYLVVADHAGNAVPACLRGLGLEQDVLQRHIAHDIGSRALAKLVAEALQASLLLANYSRLVVDLNRYLHDPTAFMPLSDRVVIPGNQQLTAEQKQRRAAAIHTPYHRAIASLLDGLVQQGSQPVLISLHSFTPALENQRRLWHIGVLWDQDPRIAVPLLARLRQHPELIVGDNEPYSGRHPSDHTMSEHGKGRGIAHICLEVRQDLLADGDGISRWGALLAAALRDILGSLPPD